MTWISETLNQALGERELKSISQQIGADETTTANALETSLPTLIAALKRNAHGGDAQGIFDAVARDHDGSLLNNLDHYLGHTEEGQGDGILGHLLGSRRSNVEAGLSRASGLNMASMGKLLSILAPMVMGALGKAQRGSQLDAKGLDVLLDQEAHDVERQNPQAMSTLNRLLDADNDGDVDLSDLARHGFGLLRKFMH